MLDHHRGLHQPRLNVGQIVYCIFKIFSVTAISPAVCSKRYLHAQEISRGSLNIGQPAHIELSSSVLEKLTRVAVTVKLTLKFLSVVFYAAHKIDKLPVRVVVDLKRRVAVFVEKNPARAAENLNVAVERSIRGEALADVLSQQLFSSDSCYRTVHIHQLLKNQAGLCAPPLFTFPLQQ